MRLLFLRFVLVSFVALLVFVAMSVSTQAQTTERFPVHGVVVDTEGQPVVDASVYLSFHLSDHQPQMTDPEGKFTLLLTRAEISEVNPIIVTTSDEMAIGWAFIQYEEGSPDIPPIEIIVYAGMREITGTVSDHEGNPISGAFVGGTFGLLAGPFHCESDEFGNFQFKYSIYVPIKFVYAVKPGNGFACLKTDEYTLYTTDPSELKVASQKYNLQLSEFSPLKFFITDENDVPIPNCFVQVTFLQSDEADDSEDFFNTIVNQSKFSVRTDEQGIAELVAVPKGWEKNSTFQIEGPLDSLAGPNHRKSGKYGNFFGKLDQLELVDGMYRVKLPRLVWVEGTVTKPDGAPAISTRIYTMIDGEYPQTAAFTDKNGSFAFYANSDTTYAVFVATNFGVAPAIFDIDPSEANPLNIQLQAKGTKFSGTIIDSEKQPVPNMFITLGEWNPTREEGKVKGLVRATLTSDEQGQFETLFVPGSNYYLIFHKEWPMQKNLGNISYVVPLDLDKMEKTYVFDETEGSVTCSDDVH